MNAIGVSELPLPTLFLMIDNFALIIGAMKCGTTSLFSYLAEHPQIAPCSEKEPDFFLANQNWDNGFDWYQNLWDWNPTEHKIALEASVNYTKIPNFPNAAEKIATVKANFKFIYIMRDPIKRIESHYKHRYVNGMESKERPLSEEIDSHLISTSRYAMQLDEYYKRFPAASILLLNFEDLKTEPLNVVKKVCRFLDLDPDYEFQEVGKIEHIPGEQILDDSLWRSLRSLKPLYSMARLIPSQHKHRIHRFFGRTVKNPKLSPEQRNFVLSELREDLRKLNLEYGVDLSHWRVEV